LAPEELFASYVSPSRVDILQMIPILSTRVGKEHLAPMGAGLQTARRREAKDLKDSKDLKDA